MHNSVWALNLKLTEQLYVAALRVLLEFALEEVHSACSFF